MRVLTVEEECAYLKAASDTAHGIQQAYEEALQGVRAAVRGEQPINPTRSYYRTLPRSRLTVGSGRKSVTG